MTDYPTRSGNTIASHEAHIMEVLAWKAAKYGAAEWHTNAEELGARGVKAAQNLAATGKIVLQSTTTTVTGLPIYKYGKLNGWGGSKTVTDYCLKGA